MSDRVPPKVYQNFVDAVSQSDGEERPLFELKVATDALSYRLLWVRAGTHNQAQQAALKFVSTATRMSRDLVNKRLIDELQKAKRNADNTAPDAEPAAEPVAT